MGLEWYMIPDEFTQARMKPEWIRLSLYGTYSQQAGRVNLRLQKSHINSILLIVLFSYIGP